jgi:hypothetical protein
MFRGVLQRKFNKLFGPALFNRKLCINQTDFVTMDDLFPLPYTRFFSFKDKDDFIYGFDFNILP